jgi:hypothetical protein
MNISRRSNKLTNFEIIEEYKSLENYKHSEFIPNNLISDVLNYYLPSFVILHKFSDTHLIGMVNIIELLNSPIENWQFNRPPDMVRCIEIARYIFNNKEKPIDTMFYISYNNLQKSLDMLDGIHRFTSLKILQNELKKSLDLITGTETEFNVTNNNIEWFNDKPILINIRFNNTQEQLMELFKTLNKSQPVPQLYLRDSGMEKRKAIEEIANEWQIKYPNHFSFSTTPNIGNTNRNKFIDLLDKIYTKYRINENKVQEFRELLEQANHNISLNIPSKIKEKTRERCQKSGCYLFLYKNDILEDMI